ncbi:hypothetical protein B0H19DRAFT_608974 [Mycena capillaripes]|nr:hypothetical protein B0H19DRAFT_608974 [Mycena capillaripes]
MSSFHMVRTRTISYQENRPHTATPITPLPQGPDKPYIQGLLDNNTVVISPSLSNPSHLYEITNVVDTSLSVAQPQQISADFQLKADSIHDLAARVRTLEAGNAESARKIQALTEEIQNNKTLAIHRQVWSRAQDALDELIFTQKQQDCLDAGFTSSQALRVALSNRTAAGHTTALTIFDQVSQDLKQAASAIRIQKRQLAELRTPMAHPQVTAADWRRLSDGLVDGAIRDQIEASIKEDGEPRFVPTVS